MSNSPKGRELRIFKEIRGEQRKTGKADLVAVASYLCAILALAVFGTFAAKEMVHFFLEWCARENPVHTLISSNIGQWAVLLARLKNSESLGWRGAHRCDLLAPSLAKNASGNAGPSRASHAESHGQLPFCPERSF